MRYAIASVFALLVVGMASTVPNDPTTVVGRLPAAPVPTRCEIVSELTNAATAQLEKLRAATRPSAPPSAATVAAVEAALQELVACANTHPGLRMLPGTVAERAVLVWTGEPWMLPDGRVAAPIITRRGARPEEWNLVVVERQDDRYVINAMLAFDARSRPSADSQPGLLSSPDQPG